MSFPLEAVPRQYEVLFSTMHSIATAYAYAGRLTDATRLLTSFASIATHDDVSDRMHVEKLLDFANWETYRVLMEGGTYDQAAAAITKAQGLMMSKVQRGRALNLDGNIHYFAARNTDKPDFGKAQELFQAAIVILIAEDSPRDLCWTVFHLGLTHQYSDEPLDAKAHFERAEKLALEHHLDLERSFIVRHLGFLAQDEKQYDKALASLLESIELREKLGFKLFLPWSYQAVAQLYEQMGRKHDALKYYEIALKLARKLGLPLQLVTVLIHYASMLEGINRRDEALMMLKEAQPYAKTIGHPQTLNLLQTKLAQINSTEKAG